MTIQQLITSEQTYQQKQLKLIASENYASKAVRKAVGSVLMNKYAEGYPGKRYYAGNKHIDEIEELARRRALEIFELDQTEWHANVQPVTGSIANLAVYNALLEPGDKILAMSLESGGHLSHGYRGNSNDHSKRITISSKIYNSSFYSVSPKTHLLDYDEIAKTATREKPQLIISGGTAYPREIDHTKLYEIAKSVDAKYMADIAHEAGLIAGGAYPTPFPHCDIATMTTRKTLRGPIGAIILARNEFAAQIDKAIFPGIQGGPMMNNIAGIAVALGETQQPEFKVYTKQVILNSQALCNELSNLGYKVLTGGTDKHLFLIDLREGPDGLKYTDGHEAAQALESVDIIVNKNTIPHDNSDSTPWKPSGLRIGTAAVTTRGMKEKEMKVIARLIDEVLKDTKDSLKIRNEVHKL